MTSASEHAFLPPSSAHLWRYCTAGPSLIRRVTPLPEDDSASREGTAAHWVLARAMTGHAIGAGEITPEGYVVSDEMVQGAELGMRYVNKVSAQATTRPMWAVEQTVRNNAIHEQCWGTPDLSFVDINARRIHIPDYKSGYGYVEVFRHPQLVTYAALIVKALQDQGYRVTDDWEVVLCVIQPRSFHREGPVRVWRTTVAELRPLWFELQMAAEEATSATPVARPGDYCEYCPARHECPALQADAYRSADRSKLPDPLQLPAPALGLELRTLEDAAKRLQARITGLQARAEQMIGTGTAVPGWGFEQGQGREKWHNPTQAITTARALGLDIAKPAEPCTPRQAREKGMPETLVGAMSERAPGSRKLVRVDSDKVAQVFGTGVIDK